MATFLLIHGSGQNAGSWSRVTTLLTARGHRVAAPELPKRAPDWSLSDYAAEIARSVDAPNTVLVAHSLSGVFLPLVHGMRECARLVFLAAVIPEPGKSVRVQFSDDPSMFSRGWIEAGPRWFEPSQLERLSREFLFHDCDEQAMPWALGTIEPLETRSLVTEPAPFDTWPSVPTAAIVASEDRTLTANWGMRTCRRVLGREPIEIAAGHCPQQSQPSEVARILDAFAASDD